MSKINEIFGVSYHEGFLVGCEFEVEFVATIKQTPPHILSIATDDSLRNEGKEFITMPTSVANTLAAHGAVFDPKYVVYGDNEQRCNERGSTHVHVNFSDRTEEQVKQFIRLYALVEPLFFDFVAEHRRNNIYCVPLSCTNMLTSLQNSLPYVVEHWHKYTAFNVKPLEQYGTIEFRHLEATSDTAKFSEWLKMIYALYTFSMENPVDLLVGDSYIYKLVNYITAMPYSRVNIYDKLQDNILNDLLLTINPTTTLINNRIKQAKVAA